MGDGGDDGNGEGKKVLKRRIRKIEARQDGIPGIQLKGGKPRHTRRGGLTSGRRPGSWRELVILKNKLQKERKAAGYHWRRSLLENIKGKESKICLRYTLKTELDHSPGDLKQGGRGHEKT